MGATGVNAFTSEDFTAYHNTFPSNQMEKWLELYSHRFEDPVFRLFQSELETVYEEKNISMDGGFGKLFEEYNASMYKKHPYGTQTILGSIEHLKNPSLKKMYEFYNTYYVANNMVLALSGDFDTETIKPMIAEKFGKWRSGDIPKFPEYKEENFNGRVDVEVKLTPIKVGVLGYRTPSTSDEDAFVFEIASQFLSNMEMTGYLDKIGDEGLVMASALMEQSYNDYGSTMVLYAPKIVGQSFEKAEIIVMEQIEKLKAGNFTDAYFQAIILNKKKEIALQEESNFERTYYMVSSYMEGKTWTEYSEKWEILNTITKADIVAIANKYFGDNYLSLHSKMGFPKKDKIEKPKFEPVVPKNEGPSEFAQELDEIPTTKLTPRFVDFDIDIERTKVANGVTIQRVKNPFNDVFDLEIRYHVWSKTFPELELLALYAQTIGTENQSSTELKEAFHRLGASYYFEASENYFTINIEGMDENLEEILKLTNSILVGLNSDEDKMDKLRNDIKGGKKIDRDEPSYISRSLSNHILYGKNAPLQRELTKKQMKNLTGLELVKVFHKVVLYENTINYTGNVDLQKVANWSKEYLVLTNELTPAQPYWVKGYVASEGTKIYVINRKKSVQSQITFSIIASERNNDKAVQISAFNNYFGGDMSSIVFQEIREFRSLAYSAYGFYRLASMQGKENRFSGFVGCQSDKTNEAIEVMDSLINFMPEKPDRMESIVSALTEKAQSSRPNFRYILNSYDYWKRVGYTEDPNKTNLNKYANLEFQDIVDFQKAELKDKPMVITIVGDVSKFDLDRLKKIGEVIIIKEKELYVN
jgi:predicted Zn-dependent peptidase